MTGGMITFLLLSHWNKSPRKKVADLSLQKIIKEGEWIKRFLCRSEVSWGSSCWGTLKYPINLLRTGAKGISHLMNIIHLSLFNHTMYIAHC